MWHQYGRDRILAILAETRASLFAFDGVAPYPGILHARSERPDVAFVWFRRGMWRAGANARAFRAAPYFDLIIEPGDLAGTADRGPTARRGDALRVPPISLIEHEPLLSRQEAAAELGLDPDRPTALVTLGSGVASHVADPAAMAIDALLTDPAWQIAVTQSHLARGALRVVDASRIIELRKVYPLVRFLRAFDTAVSAAGYNSFHELLFAGVPTLLVPSPRGTDDQTARARWAGRQDVALVADGDDVGAIAKQATRLLDPSVRHDLAAACHELPRPSGAEMAASHLTSVGQSFSGHRPTSAHRLSSGRLFAEGLTMRAIGSRGAAVARRLLGRPASSSPASRLHVDVGEPSSGQTSARQLLITESLDALGSDAIVEHLLQGSSSDYGQARRAIAARYYDIR
jgi:hypothetical protein